MEDMRPGFGPVLGPPHPRDCVEWLDGQYAREDAKNARRLTRWLIIASILGGLAILLATQARADEPYLEVSGLRIQSYVKSFAGVTERLVEQRGLWGGEIVARIPFKDRWAVIGRGYSEGAAGSYSYKDPGTFHRAVGKLALSYRVARFALDDTPDRYSLAVIAGGGVSWLLERGRYLADVPLEEVTTEGPPPVFGLGLHLRDSRLGRWFNLRAEWDKAVSMEGAAWCGGCILAGSVHIPVLERAGVVGGFGIDVSYGEFAKVNLLTKVRLKRWGGK